MFEIPFNFILINPAIDILLFISVSYYFLFKLYRKLLNSKAEQIVWIDFKVTIIFLLLGYLDYSGKIIDFFGFKMDWWFYIILVQFFIEGVYVFIFWEDSKKYFKIIRKNSKQKEIENIELKIVEMNSIKKFMETDFNKYKIQGNKDAMEKLNSEIEKISISIDELEENLREIKSKKNDQKE